MRAIYKNEEFLSAILHKLNLISIVTYEERSEEEGFEAKRDYYVKYVKIEDEDLEELYEKEFYVRYKDSVEENEIWEILYGTYLEMDIQRGIVVITLSKMRSDNKWKIVEKGASEKQISLKDCTEYMIKTIYRKKAGKVVDTIADRMTQVHVKSEELTTNTDKTILEEVLVKLNKLEKTISVSEEEFKKAMLKNRVREYKKQCIILNMLKRGQI